MASARPDVYLTVDLGGSRTRAAVVTPDGTILGKRARPTPRRGGPPAVVRAIVQAARDALATTDVRLADVRAIGIGAPGPLNLAAGTVYFIPNLPGWKEVPLREMVESEMGRPTVMGNDADAAALGEHTFGAGRGTSDMIYITVSTGIGGGLILRNKLYAGKTATSELGHMTIEDDGPICGCGNAGCWEALASGTALAREARDRLRAGSNSIMLDLTGGSLTKVDAKVVHRAALKGDALAKELIATAGHYLGIGLANLTNIFNPEMIVLGGGLTNMGDLLLEPARTSLRSRAMEPHLRGLRLELAELGDDAGLIGAMIFAREAAGKGRRKSGKP